MDTINDTIISDVPNSGDCCLCSDKPGCKCIEKYCVEDFVIPGPPIEIEPCHDYELFDAGDIRLQSQGRLLEIKLDLKKVCPNRAVALGIILYELDHVCNEHVRGFKAIKIPGHCKPVCCDIKVKGIWFVLPEEDDASGCPASICDKRKFRVRIIAHYITTDVPPPRC